MHLIDSKEKSRLNHVDAEMTIALSGCLQKKPARKWTVFVNKYFNNSDQFDLRFRFVFNKMIYQNIISAIGLIGIGAIMKSIIDSYLKNWELKGQSQHEFKSSRYKVIILLANAMLDFEKHKPDLLNHGRVFSNTTQLADELKTERNNMILFASDQVIRTLNFFIINSTEENFFELAIAMRKDLYGLKTRLNPASLKL